VEIQLSLQSVDWEVAGGLNVRIGVHCAPNATNDQVDQVIANRAARIMLAAWPGQILVSSVAMSVYSAPRDCEFADLGAHRLKGIEEPLRLFGLIHPRFPVREFPPPRSLTAPVQAAPVQSEPIYGRDAELRAAVDLLAQPRSLLTLTGAGGAGKTRLALEVAASLPKDLAVCFADLENEQSVEALKGALASALRLPLSAGASGEDQIIAYLRERSLVIVLDNADAVAGAAEFLDQVLEACHEIRCLVTRREPLGAPRETVIRLAGLPPPASADAILTTPASVLFVQAARRFDGDFALAPDDFAAFVEICEAVGGSPLALHLVAQWTKFMSMRDIAKNLNDGLGFLDDLSGDGQGRRSLLRVFEGSWALLSEALRTALARLSVFRGGFDLEAARAVAELDAPVLDILERKCLIESRGRGRFVLHPLLHEYAFGKLKEAELGAVGGTQARHSAYFLALAQSCFVQARSASGVSARNRFQGESANLRAAWTYLAARGDDALLRENAEAVFYACALCYAYRECDALFATPVQTPGLGAYFAALRANSAVQQCKYEQGSALAHEALSGAGGDWIVAAHAHQALGNIAHIKGEVREAHQHYAQALALRAGGADDFGCFYTVMSLAMLAVHESDLADAKRWVKEAYQICHRLDSALGMQLVHACAGDIALKEGRLEDAEASYAEALRLEEGNAHPQFRASSLVRLAGVNALQGRLGRAIAQFDEACEVASALGDKRVRVNALLGKARNMRLAGDTNGARSVSVEALADARALGSALQMGQALLELALAELEAGDRRRALRFASYLEFFEDEALRAAAAAHFGPSDEAAPVIRLDEALLQIIKEHEYGRLRL
ncbi:ATP-binding protein, partial [Terricaulis sp.]|uniref:ATP-binding protein n=1 Tax=Terricaulis sp. TaxID=2768686 RepID=UPI002AC7947E